MESINSTMISKFISTYKDKNRIYFLTEYVPGIDLYDALREMRLLSDTDAKFFTAQILQILSELHSKQIVHRDIKPENFVVDKNGYLKLVDL